MAREPAARGPSLRWRLFRALAVVGATLLVLCAFSTAAVTRLGGAIGLILRENYASVVACQDMSEALERQDAAALFSASGRTDTARAMLVTDRARFADAYAREAKNLTLPGEDALVRQVETDYRSYERAVDALLELPEERRMGSYFAQVRPRSSAVRDKIMTIRVMNQRSMERADQEARRVARRTLELAVLGTGMALAVAGWFALRIPKMVLAPIASFTQHARNIGEGKLDAKVPRPEVSELGVLAEALNRMQERLRAYRESSLGELLAAKDLSRATIASMVDPVIVFSTRGEVLLANDAAESTFGITSGDVDLLRQSGVQIPEPIAVARDAVLSHGQALLPQSLADAMRWITPAGESYLLVRASPLHNDDANGAGVIVVAQDVTRFRRIDALKSDVVATVSHELKTPLTSLRLATEMLLEEGTGPLQPVQRELARTARNETERLQNTINELLDLVRIERDAGALHRMAIDPRSLLQEVGSAHRSMADSKQVTLHFTTTPSDSASEAPQCVEVDPEQITIVLSNLVSNAIRHASRPGHVWLNSRSDHSETVFSVRDDGDGIRAEQLPHIFERHWTGSEPSTLKGRHGLGLAIAHEIAQRHEGTLEVETQLGKGSTFRLRIPRTRSHEVPSDSS